jgi:hypothetical protein
MLLDSIFDPEPPCQLFKNRGMGSSSDASKGVPEGMTGELPSRFITSRSTLHQGILMQAAIVYLFEHPWRARYAHAPISVASGRG